MRKNTYRRRGFVFVATLGVLAVALLLVFAVSGGIHFSYHATGQTLGEVQEWLMAQTAAQYAVRLLAQNKMAADGKPQPFRIISDHLRGRAVEGTVAVTVPQGGQAVYQLAALAPRPGDVLVHVVSESMIQTYGRGDRYLLCNREGKRLRAIDVTDVLKRTRGQ